MFIYGTPSTVYMVKYGTPYMGIWDECTASRSVRLDQGCTLIRGNPGSVQEGYRL